MTAISPFLYARAFRKALREGMAQEEDLVRNLAASVRRRGQAAQHARIVQRVSEELVHHHGGKWVVVETARPLSNVQRKKIKDAFSEKDYILERVRPDLVSGIRIIVDGDREFDGSLKRRLAAVFH